MIRKTILILTAVFFVLSGCFTDESNVREKPEENAAQDSVTVREEQPRPMDMNRKRRPHLAAGQAKRFKSRSYVPEGRPAPAPHNTEAYDRIYDNDFREAKNTPLSTFSIDVDTASYANVRRFLNNGNMPPKDAVRLEEMVNYFSYEYAEPEGKHPFAVHTDVAGCPWKKSHKLVRIALQGKKLKMENLPPANLVFLLDVSGSMRMRNKLPLLKKAFRLLVRQLRKEDRVSIVVYAGAAGLVLPPTSGDNGERILNAIDKLRAGGSTAGGAGIKLAYKTALENHKEGANSRIILATDGDFNIGASSDAAMVRLIEEKRELGVSLSVLGFGRGNYKGSKMEKLANKGNGNYAYIDNLQEARKVLVTQVGGTLYTIAKDVKTQVEFNPKEVKGYRLLGYVNRKLEKEDFNDDKKDAGELGAGHTVTAFYEIVPAGSEEDIADVDPLKYQKNEAQDNSGGDEAAKYENELLTVKLRYKLPRASTSTLLSRTVNNSDRSFEDADNDFRFAAAVAAFAMQLRDSEHKGSVNYKSILAMARNARGTDSQGYRSEFLRLVRLAETVRMASR